MSAGYSGTPLAKKLGVKEGRRLGTFGAPPEFADLVAPLPPGAVLVRSPRISCHVLIAFAVTQKQLQTRFAGALKCLPADGGLWLSWPKKSSKIESKLNFDVVQTLGLRAGLVDNKICAVSETWSGLRLVVRKHKRATWSARS